LADLLDGRYLKISISSKMSTEKFLSLDRKQIQRGNNDLKSYQVLAESEGNVV